MISISEIPSSSPEKENAVRRVVSCVCAAKLCWRQTTKAGGRVSAQMPGNPLFLKALVGRVKKPRRVKNIKKNMKINPISVPPLRLQPWTQIWGVFHFTLAVRLVNHIVHQALVITSGGRRRLTRLCAPCEGPVSVSLSIDVDLLPLSQQVGVDQCVLDGGVHVIVFFTRFWEAIVSWQEAGAVWIVDGHLMTQFLLFLPVEVEKITAFEFTKPVDNNYGKSLKKALT